jgi:hypothetical protein
MKIAVFRNFLASAIGLTALLVPPASRVHAQSSDDDTISQERKIQIGFEIAPVKLDLRGRNAALVGLGSYYVNAQGGCADCHNCPTYQPGHNPFSPPFGENGDGRLNAAHYLSGGTPFGPPEATIRSANLTPDANGRPAGLTFQQFLNLMRTGTEPDEPDERIPVMPRPLYRHMTSRDLRAVYEFLTAIPHAELGSCTAPGQ